MMLFQSVRRILLRPSLTGLLKVPLDQARQYSNTKAKKLARYNLTWKDYYLLAEDHLRRQMPMDQKRQQSSKNQDTIYSIPTWKDYYIMDEERLKKQLPPSLSQNLDGKKRVMPDLNSKVSIFSGDITKLEVDAIVNAANNSLLGGGGVDGAIHRTAGPQLLDECRLLKGCKTGDAKLTRGYKLPAKYVIHTVGPKGEKPDLLRSCYAKSMEIALKENIRTIAFPCISTGIYGYPQESAAKVALEVIRETLEKHSADIDRIIFCTFLPADFTIYENLLQLYFPQK